MTSKKGATLIEILIGLLIVAVASIATLTYFAYAKGGVGVSGNRRAALERARERLEEMSASPILAMRPPIDTGLPPDSQPLHWVSCDTANPCQVWPPGDPDERVSVGDFPNQPVKATVQWKDDFGAGTTDVPDTLELAVKVWFTPGDTTDDDFHRVTVRTLRTP